MTRTHAAARCLYGVFGTGGCGRSVMPVAEAMLSADTECDDYELVFLDDAPATNTLNGHRVMTLEAFRESPARSRAVSVAVADWRARQEIANRCAEQGLPFFAISAPNAVIMDEVEIAPGSIVSPFATIGSNVRIGRQCHINLYAYVEHDCRIGDFVTFAPGVRCNGNVRVGDRAFLGSGCVVRQGSADKPLVIGAEAVVGMGAVVTKDVPPGFTVIGNPARPMKGS